MIQHPRPSLQDRILAAPGAFEIAQLLDEGDGYQNAGKSKRARWRRKAANRLRELEGSP